MADREEIIARLERIAEKLSRLRDADRDFSVFGSDSHGYQLYAPLSDSALASCERYLGVELPLEYRLFVTRLGDGGGGRITAYSSSTIRILKTSPVSS